MKKNNVLVTLADGNFVEQAKQLFASAYLYGKWKGDYLLIAYNIPKKKLNWFRKKGIIVKSFPDIKQSIKNHVNYPERITSIMFTKYYLFTKFFKQWKRVVFLDSDIIIKKSLICLERIKGFNAVKDFDSKISSQFIQNKKTSFKNFLENYDVEETAFNVGVMAFTTNIIKENSFKELLKLTKKYKKIIRFPEQAILNLYFYKKWNNLGYSYNAYSLLTRKCTPRVTHFITLPRSKKPWDDSSFWYSFWRGNLELFNKLNFKNLPFGEDKCCFLNKINDWIIDKIIHFNMLFYSKNYLIERFLGKLGIYLKKKHPKLYSLLKYRKFSK